MIITEGKFRVRHIERGVYAWRLPYRGLQDIKPIDTIQRWGKGHFVSEVKQLIEVERTARGYYPPLEEIFSIIEREFGATFAEQSRLSKLPCALRLWGVCYSEAGAAAYHAEREGGQPLLDLNAPYRLPWGTVNNYLLWKLPRLDVWDSFEVGGLVIRRAHDSVFSIIGRGVSCSASSEDHTEAVVRVLMILRGDNPSLVNRVITPRSYFGRVFAPVRVKAAPVRVAVKRVPVTVRRSAPEPAPVRYNREPEPAPRLEPLPPLRYGRTAERQYLVQLYLVKGYSLDAIQAALVPVNLAAKGRGKVQ